MDNGRVKEGLISVGSTRSEEVDPLDPEIIQRLDNKFEYRDMPEDYYTYEDGDEVTIVFHFYANFGSYQNNLQIFVNDSICT